MDTTPAATHPIDELDQRDLVYTLEPAVSQPEATLYTVTVTHTPSRLTGAATAASAEAATVQAKDDLLRKLEEMGGC